MIVCTKQPFFTFTGAGAYAGCTYRATSEEYSQALSKMVYLNHRSFLPSVDHLFSKHKGFPEKLVKPFPSLKTMAHIHSANAKYVTVHVERWYKSVKLISSYRPQR